MDVYSKDVSNARVKCKGKWSASLGPELVGDAVSLTSKEALVIEKAMGVGNASRVTLTSSAKIFDNSGTERCI